jgi:uncharacterized protein YndB with AHSA1/START domain
MSLEMQEFRHNLVIMAPPARVIEAFFDPRALTDWWQVSRSVCVPRPLGSYAVEWEATDWRDDVLGRLGGALHATVMEFKPGREFFLADTYWLAPDGEALGPMALEVTCHKHPWGAELHLRHSGFDEGPRWARYYEITATGWERALKSLKTYLERV